MWLTVYLQKSIAFTTLPSRSNCYGSLCFGFLYGISYIWLSAYRNRRLVDFLILGSSFAGTWASTETALQCLENIFVFWSRINHSVVLFLIFCSLCSFVQTAPLFSLSDHEENNFIMNWQSDHQFVFSFSVLLHVHIFIENTSTVSFFFRSHCRALSIFISIWHIATKNDVCVYIICISIMNDIRINFIHKWC